ncbi:Disease resistance protein [Corchorus capsularis]|uniref:Disease resistance protein n=1 Tax=Corchorus capsularis TaxID=210143 RepID=A0A1R3JHV6_COCAP|nr:Disease resistance protein [Corchorus capsularis]
MEPTILGALELLCGSRTRIEQDVEAIRRDLRHLESILGNYDATETNYQQHPMEEIQKLRIASFRAADALEEYDYDLQNARKDHVDPLFHSLYGIFKFIINNLKTHAIASGIKHARATLSRVLDEFDRQGQFYSKLRSLKEDDDLLLEQEDDLVGIEQPRKKLMPWLLSNDPRLKVISVVGMAGTGKTTLVKKLYDDVSCKNRFRYHFWTTISQQFNMDEILKDIIRQIYGRDRRPIPRGVETMKISELGTMVQDSLRSSSYLLILDDFRSINDWNSIIKTLPRGFRSRIVLTSRHADVAPPANQKFDAHNFSMEKLSQEESKALFCRKAFQDGRCPANLEEIVEKILRKCDGLPLAINAIGGFLRRKAEIRDWERVYNNLGFELTRNNEELGFMKKLLIPSYNELPEELKSCFLYLSMFPEDYKIEYNRLIRLWVAEKFVQPIEEKTGEEVAEEYFKMLLNRYLIQAAETSSDGRVKTCRVHDILHQICIIKADDQNFAAIHKDGDAALPDNVRRLSIHNGLGKAKQIWNNSIVRALFVFGLVDSPSKANLHELLIKNHKKVRLLDLQAAPLKQFPHGITNLVHLRYLSMRHTKVEAIPSSISKLRNLETLDLKHAHVSKLPASIVKLHKLRVLLVYRYDQIESYTHSHYKYGFNPPANLGKLKFLQKLSFLEATHGRHMLNEIGSLSQLRRLGIIKLREEDGKALCSSIKKLSQLRALSITSMDEKEIIDLPKEQLSQDFRLQCLHRLQRLYLTGPLRELPKWIPMVDSLVRLSLRGSRLKDPPLAGLRHLPELVHLDLLEAYNGKDLHFMNGGFWKLKVLVIDKLDELETIEVDEKAMPSLEKLIIQRCMMLRKVPRGIQHLKSIKVLEFFDMPQELIEILRPGDPGSENWKIAHISQVHSTHWNKGWQSQSLSPLNELERS